MFGFTNAQPRSQVVRDIVGLIVMLALLAAVFVVKFWAFLPHGGLQ